MANNQLPQDLLNKIKTCIRVTKREIAKQIANDLRQEYSNAIWKFYKHYKPRMYQRSFETLFANNLYRARGDYRKITKWQDDGFIIKFSVGSEFIQEPYEDDNEYVFNRTFEQGIHGWIPVSSTFRKTIASSVNSDSMDWRLRVKQPRKPLNPPPKDTMDKWFERYKTERNLNKICKPILQKNIEKYLYNG